MPDPTTTQAPLRALELVIGRARIAVPVTTIARVVSIAYEHLPLAHGLVAGLGFEDARTIVCVSLTPGRPAAERATAVLFETKGPLGFGLCIDTALELVDVVRVERGAAQANLPRWVRRAWTSDGRTLGWIDAGALIEDLSAREVRA